MGKQGYVSSREKKSSNISEKIFTSAHKGEREEEMKLCLITVFVFYFQKLVFGNIKKKKFLVFFKSKTCLVS